MVYAVISVFFEPGYRISLNPAHISRYVGAMKHQQPSKHSAKMLLAAWSSSDSELINDAADSADTAAPLSTLEAERLEVVRAAGKVLRKSAEGIGSAEDIEASLFVLRNFVRPRVMAALPLGRRAYYPH
jgi:hypothetical protein